MRNLILAAGVAALAIAAPAAAERGGKGGEKRAQATKVERGGGNARAAKADRQQSRAGGRQKARSENRQRAGAADRQQARSNARRQARSARAERRGNDARAAGQARRAEQRRAARQDRDRAEQRQVARQNRENRARAEQRRAARQDRVRAEQRRAARRDRVRAEQRQLARQNRIERDDRRIVRLNRDDRDRRVALRDDRRRLFRDRDFDRDRFERRFASRGIPASFGCPPGLAMQNELCMPPGQYRKLVGRRLPASYASNRIPTGLRSLYRDTDDYYWRYGDGYAYRVDRDEQLIRTVLPLIGAGLGIGMPFPYSSPTYYVPSSYQSFYPDTPYSYHRYANGYVYEIDRNTGLIDDMIPFYGQSYGVGQMLPASYSYYNVPYPYRSWYRDDDDYFYRYAPGAIYQVDRDTQLITAIVSLLTGGNGLAVGQPLPMGYDAYNVPYGYRDRYYDTPDSWYRYSNGYIYQVDPTTRLITAVIDAIV